MAEEIARFIMIGVGWGGLAPSMAGKLGPTADDTGHPLRPSLPTNILSEGSGKTLAATPTPGRRSHSFSILAPDMLYCVGADLGRFSSTCNFMTKQYRVFVGARFPIHRCQSKNTCGISSHNKILWSKSSKNNDFLSTHWQRLK